MEQRRNDTRHRRLCRESDHSEWADFAPPADRKLIVRFAHEGAAATVSQTLAGLADPLIRPRSWKNNYGTPSNSREIQLEPWEANAPEFQEVIVSPT